MSKNINKYINLSNLEYERSTPAKASQVQEKHYITEQRDEIEFCFARKKKTQCILQGAFGSVCT